VSKSELDGKEDLTAASDGEGAGAGAEGVEKTAVEVGTDGDKLEMEGTGEVIERLVVVGRTAAAMWPLPLLLLDLDRVDVLDTTAATDTMLVCSEVTIWPVAVGEAPV